MYAFDYHRPSTLRQAVSMLGKAEDPKLLAGGQTLIPTLKNRLAQPANIIDLGGLGELAGIEQKGKAVIIGAMTRHADVASSDIVRKAVPALAALAGGIGDPHVRHRGTIGGSIANNDPAADYPAACLGLGATIITNKRKIAADDFFTGMFGTVLEDGEVITRISFPAITKAGYAKFANPASRYALVGVFASAKGKDVRVAVTGAGASGVFRWKEAEEALKPRFAVAPVERLAKPKASNLNSDIHASAEYRAHLIHVMTKRAVAKALGKG
jgi:aerobic carbon-monoxide dehydrogenase medium subunit